MFEGLQKTLTGALRKLRGKGRLSEANIRESMDEVRTALLDADVHLDVASAFITRVTKRAIGQEVLKSLDPGEQVFKVVYDELVALMGPVDTTIPVAQGRPTVIMLCGLQGQGKTTTAGKLALYLKQRGRKVLLVAADLQRPAAIDQLELLGKQVDTPVYREDVKFGPDGARLGPNPIDVCKRGVTQARSLLLDTVILDTAGRLHVAEMPMDELRQIDKTIQPDQVYFVCDAMTGQDAVLSARAFNEALEINGVILTKLDGDARGGAALSIKEITKVPIKFVGMGEKLDRLEDFRPEGMAQRILGQGDILSLVEKVNRVQSEITEEERTRQQKKMEAGDYTLEDFRQQLPLIRKMGPLKDVLGSMPGMSEMMPADQDPEASIRRIQGIIDSMTTKERKNPDDIDYARRMRIAKGSGVQATEVKQLVTVFDQIRSFMRPIAKMSMLERIRMVSGLGKMGGFMPGAKIAVKDQGDGGLSPRDRAALRRKKKHR